MIPYSSITSTVISIKDENKNNSMFVGESSTKNARDSNNFVITIDAANNSTPTDSTPCQSTLTSTPIITYTPHSDSNNDGVGCINAAADTNLITSCNHVILSIPSSGPSLSTTNTLTSTSNINRKRNVSRIIRCSKSGNNASAGFGLSPKSVLQVQGCRGSGF